MLVPPADFNPRLEISFSDALPFSSLTIDLPGSIPYDIEYSSDGKTWEVIAEGVRRNYLELDPERTARKKGFYRARTR